VVLGEELGEAKIENFDGAALGDENVGGLDVAMDDAFLWAASRASASWMPMSMVRGTGREPREISLSRVCPSSSSMAMKVRPSCSSMA